MLLACLCGRVFISRRGAEARSLGFEGKRPLSPGNGGLAATAWRSGRRSPPGFQATRWKRRGARRHAGERPLDHLAFPEQPLQPARHPPVRGLLLRFLIIGVIILTFSPKVKGECGIFSEKVSGASRAPALPAPNCSGRSPPSVNATYYRFGIIALALRRVAGPRRHRHSRQKHRSLRSRSRRWNTSCGTRRRQASRGGP